MALQPTTALKMIESGELVEVPVEALQLKDTIMVAKGSAIPIDGIVIKEAAALMRRPSVANPFLSRNV